MASTVAIASTADRAESSAITVLPGDSIRVWSTVPLLAGESVNVEQSDDGGTTWYPLNDGTYGGRVLEYNRCADFLAGGGVYRLVKTPTTTATAINYD